MSDELQEQPEQPITAPRIRNRNRAGRKTTKDESAHLYAEIEALKAQLNQAIGFIKDRAAAQDAPISKFLPKPPVPVAPPKGIQYELTLVNQDMSSIGVGDSKSAFTVIVPEREGHPDQPDRRYCVFCADRSLDRTVNPPCKPRVDILYGYDFPANYTDEQAQELERLHIRHMEAMKSLQSSKVRVQDPRTSRRSSIAEKRFFAEHFELKARKIGHVPDIVANLEHEMSAAEWNERAMKRYEDDLVKISTQGGQ